MIARALSVCLSAAFSVSALAQEGASTTQFTPESAMAFLVKTLPGMNEVDTWDGGWLEAKLDGAESKKRCELITRAPFGLIHYADGTRELNRQTWELDFSSVTGVGQKGGQIIYKLRKVDQAFSYDAGTPELALRTAYAFEALRQACNSSRSAKR